MTVFSLCGESAAYMSFGKVFLQHGPDALIEFKVYLPEPFRHVFM